MLALSVVVIERRQKRRQKRRLMALIRVFS